MDGRWLSEEQGGETSSKTSGGRRIRLPGEVTSEMKRFIVEMYSAVTNQTL